MRTLPPTKTPASTSLSRWRYRRLIPLSILGVIAAFACHGAKQTASSPASLTSATIPEDTVPRNDLVRTEGERDGARRALDECRDVTSRTQSQLQITLERDALAEKAWATIDAADGALRALQLEAVRAKTVAARQKLESAAADTRERRAVVERDARKIYAHRGPAWARFKGSMDTSISDLERSIAAGENLISGMTP
jgi:hypothetical protein